MRHQEKEDMVAGRVVGGKFSWNDSGAESRTQLAGGAFLSLLFSFLLTLLPLAVERSQVAPLGWRRSRAREAEEPGRRRSQADGGAREAEVPEELDDLKDPSNQPPSLPLQTLVSSSMLCLCFYCGWDLGRGEIMVSSE